MPHTLTVEGDKVIEKSASGEVIKTSASLLSRSPDHAGLAAESLGPTRTQPDTLRTASLQDYDHVIRGYKATLHRENVSDEAKAVSLARMP